PLDVDGLFEGERAWSRKWHVGQVRGADLVENGERGGRGQAEGVVEYGQVAGEVRVGERVDDGNGLAGPIRRHLLAPLDAREINLIEPVSSPDVGGRERGLRRVAERAGRSARVCDRPGQQRGNGRRGGQERADFQFLQAQVPPKWPEVFSR